MKRFFIEQNLQVNTCVLLEGEIYNQMVNVLRLRENEQVILFNGYTYDYICTILKINKKNAEVFVESEILNTKNPRVNITLFQALVKGEKFELITQKITEIGAKALVPVKTEFVEVKENTTKLNRLPKITQEACKQCGRSVPVEIENIMSFDKMIEELSNFDEVYFAYEKEQKPLEIKPIEAKNIAIVVGSEGGFSEQESLKLSKLKNVKTISLGRRILRAETAAITLTNTIMFLTQEN